MSSIKITKMKLKIKVPTYALATEYKKELRKVMRQAGNEIVRDAKALVRSGNKNTVSIPGQPPISKTGALASAIKLSARNNGLKLIISDPMPALFLEAGAKGGGNRSKGKGRNKKEQLGTKRVLEPRPFISVAAESNISSLEKRIATALRNGIDLKKVRD